MKVHLPEVYNQFDFANPDISSGKRYETDRSAASAVYDEQPTRDRAGEKSGRAICLQDHEQRGEPDPIPL